MLSHDIENDFSVSYPLSTVNTYLFAITSAMKIMDKGEYIKLEPLIILCQEKKTL